MNLPDCIHRWRLQDHGGGDFVSGRCTKCGLRRRDFAAHEGALSVEFTTTGMAIPRGTRRPPKIKRKVRA